MKCKVRRDRLVRCSLRARAAWLGEVGLDFNRCAHLNVPVAGRKPPAPSPWSLFGGRAKHWSLRRTDQGVEGLPQTRKKTGRRCAGHSCPMVDDTYDTVCVASHAKPGSWPSAHAERELQLLMADAGTAENRAFWTASMRDFVKQSLKEPRPRLRTRARCVEASDRDRAAPRRLERCATATSHRNEYGGIARP